jgi:hypothetical protein
LVTSSLDPRWLKALEGLTARGVRPIAIFVDPASVNFAVDSSTMLALTREQRFPVFVVDFDAGIANAFSLEARITRGVETAGFRPEGAIV